MRTPIIVMLVIPALTSCGSPKSESVAPLELKLGLTDKECENILTRTGDVKGISDAVGDLVGLVSHDVSDQMYWVEWYQFKDGTCLELVFKGTGDHRVTWHLEFITLGEKTKSVRNKADWVNQKRTAFKTLTLPNREGEIDDR